MWKMLQCVLVCLVFFVVSCECQKNNVCKTVKDYFTLETNPNCWYDYITSLSVPKIIAESGRPFEEHKVTTKDGYIVAIFRIPNTNSNNKKSYPVFLQHGLISSSSDWLTLGNDSLALQLHNEGYDVWLNNYRGTEYSMEHLNYTANDDEFWDYSIDDIARYDIPAALELISDKTGAKDGIIYIGHSMGTSLYLMYSSEYPEEAKKHIKYSILAAPAYKLLAITTPAKYIASFRFLIWSVIRRLNLIRLTSHVVPTKGILSLICLYNPTLLDVCFEALKLIYGDRTSVGPDKYPTWFHQHPAGTSIKVIRHIGDFVFGRFGKFDYGLDNFKVYGRTTPPDFNVSQISIPTSIIYARNDWLTTKKDAIRLFRELSPRTRQILYEIPADNFNHIDFVMGSTAKSLFVDYVLKLLSAIPTMD